MGHFFESQSGKLDWILAITWVCFDKFCDLIWLEGLDYDQQLIQESRPVCCDLLSFEINWFDLESVQESRPVQWLGQPPPSHIHSCSWPSASNTARNPLWSSCKPFKDFVSKCLGHGGGVRNLPFQKIVSSVNASSTLRIKPGLYQIVWASFMIWTKWIIITVTNI